MTRCKIWNNALLWLIMNTWCYRPADIFNCSIYFCTFSFLHFLQFFCFRCFELYFAYCHTSCTWASGSDTQVNLIPRIDINNKLTDTLIICIARKRPDVCYLINEVFMQRPLRRLRNLICLLFLYILIVLVEIKQSITFLTKSK